MRIAFVNQPFDGVLPPDLNSIGLWSYEMARRMAGPHRVRIYAGARRMRGRRDGRQGVEYVFKPVLPGNWLRRLYERFPAFEMPGRPYFARSCFYLDYVFQVARDLRRFRPDIVHVLNFSQFLPAFKKASPGALVALHMQCEWLTQLDGAMTDRRLASADAIIGCSNYIVETIRRAFPRHAARCHCLYNGVDPAIFAPVKSAGATPEKTGPEILFVGRVSAEKGVHDLAAAFTSVLRHHPDAQLRLVGAVTKNLIDMIARAPGNDPITLAAYRRYANNYPRALERLLGTASANVHFEGNVPNDQLPRYYQRADVFVFPSAWNEPFGIPVIEAMACQRPVVATRSGAFPEIIEHNLTGLLVERGNPQAVGQAILRLLKDDQLRASLGQAGRQRVLERFSWDRAAADLLKIYAAGGVNRN